MMDTRPLTEFLTSAGVESYSNEVEFSRKVRSYLFTLNIEELRFLAETILHTPYRNGGFILQDIINCCGNIMGFEVEFGRYKGNRQQISPDGVWTTSKTNLVIEVKTTDTFRISTQTLLKYSNEVQKTYNFKSPPKVLIIVGRFDISDFESQIRGSRADDRISLIGIDAILNLTKAISQLLQGPACESIRAMLTPHDHTNLNYLSALVLDIISESQKSLNYLEPESTTIQSIETEEHDLQSASREDLLDQLKHTLLPTLDAEGANQKNQLAGPDGEYFYIASSKRYERPDQQYWFTISQKKIDKLHYTKGVLVLFYLDKHEYSTVDSDALKLEVVPYLNVFEKNSLKLYHLGVKEIENSMVLLLPKKGRESSMPISTKALDKKR